MSPISSRKIVPPFAASNLPALSFTAEVNAPLTWPNNSLSINSEGIAAQLTSIKGAEFLKLFIWIWWATNSFPDPFGPCIKTFAFVKATLSIITLISLTGSDLPIILYSFDLLDLVFPFFTKLLFNKADLTEFNSRFKSGGLEI